MHGVWMGALHTFALGAMGSEMWITMALPVAGSGSGEGVAVGPVI